MLKHSWPTGSSEKKCL